MGPRRRDRRQGQSLPLGWDEPADPSGAPASEPAGEVSKDHSTAPPARRMSPRLRRILAIGSAALLVAALTVGLPRLLAVSDGPERAVTGFLQAVVDGDMEQVREHAEDAPDASSAALTDEIMRSATGGIESFEIDEVEVDGDTATVTALLHDGTTTDTVAFALSASSGSAFAPVTWELAPVALPEFVIEVPVAAEEVVVNGVTIPLEDLALSRASYLPQIAVQLLPGSYELSIVMASPWAEVPSRSLEAPLTFGQWRKPIRDLQLDLSAEGKQEMESLIDSHLQECLRSASAEPEGCPVPESEGPDGHSETEVTGFDGAWALVEGPEINVGASYGDAVWSVHGEGRARPTAPGEAGAPTQEVPVAFYGTVYLDPEDELRYHPDPSAGSGALSFIYCTDAATGLTTGIIMVESNDAGETEWEGSCG